MATKTNKKDWSLVVWLFGWLLNFVTVLKKLATKLGVPFDAFERLASEAGEETLIRVLQLILDDYNASLPKPPAMQGSAHYRDAAVQALPPDHYRVSVTYAPIPSIDELKKEWGKDNVSVIFDGRPFSFHASCVGMDRTPGERTFYVHDAGGDWESEEQIAWGAKQCNAAAPNGYRPATHEETYEFAKAHPELVDYAGLGAFAMDGGLRYVARVWQRGGRRILDGRWFAGRWGRRTRVLFVSK